MGFRFRKSIGKGPFRMTFSKSGVSTSFGGPGARVTKRADGKTQTTLSAPGTGISHTSTSSSKKKTANTQTEAGNSVNATISPKTLSVIFRVLSIPMFLLGILLCFAVPVVGVCSIGIGVIEWIVANHFKKKIKIVEGETE